MSHPTYEQRLALCSAHVTLDGKPASINRIRQRQALCLLGQAIDGHYRSRYGCRLTAIVIGWFP